MLHISPIKIAAGIAAVLLAVTGLFYFSEARQGVVNMFAAPKKPASTTAQPSRPTEVAATASGVRVIPIGVAPTAAPAKASSANAGRPSGG
jgi:NADH:ubiquinone oxidoreductase subunit 2 (subunit N)